MTCSTESRRSQLAPEGRTGLLAGAAFAAVVCAAGCGKGAGSPGEAGAGFGFPPTAIEVARVEKTEIVDRFDAVGTIEAGEIVTVVSEIDAKVIRLPFREGERIRQGALIAQLDDAALAAELARAEALREQSRISHERVKLVVESGAGAQQDLDDAAAALQVAEANVSLARAHLAKATIQAPFDGVIGARRVSPGAFLRPGDAIAELAQMHAVKVTFSAPEKYIPSLARGAKVSVSTTAYPGYVLSGTIDVVDPVLDAATRNVRVIARVPNPELRFRPGMSADVSAVLASRPEALKVPNEAIFAEGDQFLVFVVTPDSSVAKAPVRLGSRFREFVEVVEGLQGEELIVRAGHQKLFPGAKVSWASPEAAQESGVAGSEAASPASDAAGEAVIMTEEKSS